MRAVVQRVSRARVVVEERVTGEIAAGVVVLLGVARTDTPESAAYLAEKTAHLRIFDDDQGTRVLPSNEVGEIADRKSVV